MACLAKRRGYRRGRDSNPRYKLKLVRRFSKPLPSATRPPLRKEVGVVYTGPRAIASGIWDAGVWFHDSCPSGLKYDFLEPLTLQVISEQ